MNIEIPDDHPLAQLLKRADEAGQLPSCKGCRHSRDYIESTVDCHLQFVDQDLFSVEESGGGTLAAGNSHFCAAWEPKVVLVYPELDQHRPAEQPQDC